MRYMIKILSKKGKVKGAVGANSEKTVIHIIEMWYDTHKDGYIEVLDTVTNEITRIKRKGE